MTSAPEFAKVKASLIFEPITLARSVNPERVSQLAESIKESGLINPIMVVRKQRHMRNDLVDAYEIVAGVHRFHAMFRVLRWEEIEVKIVTIDSLHAELLSIDENLIREPLCREDEALALARRKEIYEELHPETKQGAASGGNQYVGKEVDSRPVGDLASGNVLRFTKDTAAKTGKSERSIQRLTEWGEKISPDALALVKGTPLSKRDYLDELKNVSADKQLQHVKDNLARLNQKPKATRAKKKPSQPASEPKPPAATSSAEPCNDEDGYAVWLADLIRVLDRAELNWRFDGLEHYFGDSITINRRAA
jgi:ParB family chromosome partitioning protein